MVTKISGFSDAHIPRNRGLNIEFLPVRKPIRNTEILVLHMARLRMKDI